MVEHDRAGPEAILHEAWRVLKPGGIALVSVPWFNALRRYQARRNKFAETVPDQTPFYQFAFREDEFTSILDSCGFEVVEVTGYDSVKGLNDEIAALSKLTRLWPRGVKFLTRWSLRFAPAISRKTGHMLLVVFKKQVDKE